jgi:outer membrane receptor protein involved in Fe transport
MTKLNRFSVGLLTGALGLMSGRFAQAEQAQPADAAANPDELTEVVVTGSRVITNGNDSPTPLTVISAQELQNTHPTTVFDGLVDLPQFAGSRGAIGAATGTPGGSNGANNAQIAALSLEGLGPIRTLVLYDGHRVPTTQQNGLVDSNTIPQMLIQRVDIVTGGASAVYGSDAIGGVVNFVTDRNFNGVKVNLQGGVNQQGLDGGYKLGAAFGTSLFGGQGHFEGSIDASHDQGVLHRSAIARFGPRYTILGDGSAQYPYFLAGNVYNTTATFGGKIVQGTGAVNPLANMTFSSNGVLTPFVQGDASGQKTATDAVGGDGIYFPYSTLVPRDDLYQLYGRFDYDLSDTLHYYLSASGTVDHNLGYTTSTNLFSPGGNFSVNNAYLPANYGAQMKAAGLTTFNFAKIFGAGSNVPAQNGDFYSRSLYINTGLEGKLGNGYKWEVSYTRSGAIEDVINNWTYNNGRLFAAEDAVADPSNPNNVVCNVTISNPGLYPGCVPINLFGPNAITQAASDYIREIMNFRSHIHTDDVVADITGAPFSTWAGPVNMALSAEWRTEGYNLWSSQPTVNFAPLDCTGLRFNCASPSATNLGTAGDNNSVAPRPLVSQTVKEGALEADVPLLKNVPFAQAVNVNLAYRYAAYTDSGNGDITKPNYDTYFSANTWKAGLDWHFNDEVTFRATRSRDFRAPVLSADLFPAQSVTTGGGNTDNWTGSNLTPQKTNPLNISGGNASLQPEVGYTTTAGIVLRPTTNFSVALDYFNVQITNYIQTVQGFNAAVQASCYASGGTSSYCSLQVRPLPLAASKDPNVNSVTTWYIIPLNIATMRTQGLNFEANYKTRLFDRALTLRGLLAYQPHLLLRQPNLPDQDTAGQENSDSPRVRVTLMAHYNVTDRFGIDWQTRWRDKLHYITLASNCTPTTTGCFALPSTDVPSVAYSDLNLSYQLDGPFNGQTTAYLNIRNVFNQQAPIAGGTSAFPTPGGYAFGDDPLGRFFYVGFRYRR